MLSKKQQCNGKDADKDVILSQKRRQHKLIKWVQLCILWHEPFWVAFTSIHQSMSVGRKKNEEKHVEENVLRTLELHRSERLLSQHLKRA